jgi:hypothetical protein
MAFIVIGGGGGSKSKQVIWGDDTTFEFLNNYYRIHIYIESSHRHPLIQIVCSLVSAVDPNKCFSTEPNYKLKLFKTTHIKKPITIKQRGLYNWHQVIASTRME